MNKAITAIAAILSMVPVTAFAEGPAAVTPPAAAQPSDQGVAPDETAADRSSVHEGLLLRMSVGVGALGAGVEFDDGTELGIGGVGPSLDMHIGYAVVPNLAVHANFMTMGSADMRAEETHSDEADWEGPDAFGTAGLGVGVTYYIMPLDLGLSLSALYAGVALETEQDDRLETDAAVLGKLDVTKEWAVSETWGLGVGGSVYAGKGRGEDADGVNFDTGIGGAALNLTATYF